MGVVLYCEWVFISSDDLLFPNMCKFSSVDTYCIKEKPQQIVVRFSGCMLDRAFVSVAQGVMVKGKNANCWKGHCAADLLERTKLFSFGPNVGFVCTVSKCNEPLTDQKYLSIVNTSELFKNQLLQHYTTA